MFEEIFDGGEALSGELLFEEFEQRCRGLYAKSSRVLRGIGACVGRDTAIVTRVYVAICDGAALRTGRWFGMRVCAFDAVDLAGMRVCAFDTVDLAGMRGFGGWRVVRMLSFHCLE